MPQLPCEWQPHHQTTSAPAQLLISMTAAPPDHLTSSSAADLNGMDTAPNSLSMAACALRTLVLVHTVQVPLMRDPATLQSQCVGCQRVYTPAEVQVCVCLCQRSHSLSLQLARQAATCSQPLLALGTALIQPAPLQQHSTCLQRHRYVESCLWT
jgi:hypothetical protein